MDGEEDIDLSTLLEKNLMSANKQVDNLKQNQMLLHHKAPPPPQSNHIFSCHR